MKADIALLESILKIRADGEKPAKLVLTDGENTKEYDLWKRIHQKQRERSMCDSFTFFHRCLRSYSQSHRLHISSGTSSLT